MDKETIKKQYNELVSNIEEMKMYDGRGTVDRYICDTCGYMIHTTYKDKGVTPFTMRCCKCNGTMYHSQTFKKETVPDWVNVKNWYRPTLEQTLQERQGTIEHILKGGLLLEGMKMNTEEIIQHVIDFVKPLYYKELDVEDDRDAHFIAILTLCAEYVLNKYKEKEKGNEQRND